MALRVEFRRDTLETTTGDGGFDYSYHDSIYYDPPPHDADYFADWLQFLDFYWSEMSGGAVALDTNWAIYPPGERAAYQLSKQMWQYNWNSADEQLQKGLAELFQDAVAAADESGDINWTGFDPDNDLLIIFHAGAGAEFIVGGFDPTPHDIPSAWMVKDDFARQLDLPDGIPVDGGNKHITGGLILPETESRGGVQISLAGVMCSLFGHWLGLPALYDADDGTPVAGKWSLMDRGFGNYYGAIPGELDAWSRTYMGWIEPRTAAPGDWQIAARGYGADDLQRPVKVPISGSEYYLLECRSRDPEGDQRAVATDRFGNKLIFTERYDSLIVDPGFRVPRRIDNLDFDSPGSGILIWHVDELLLDNADGFNAYDDRRGLDLEEADGAQDIGYELPFPLSLYGLDYGIADDAWFAGNLAHRDANHSERESFGDHTFPNSRANSGAFTHIALDGFTAVDTVMGFVLREQSWALAQPISHGLKMQAFAVGNFDDSPGDEFVLFDTSKAAIFDGDGALLRSITFDWNFTQTDRDPLVYDLDNDGYDEVIWMAMEYDWTIHLLLWKDGSLTSIDTLQHSGGVLRAKSIIVGNGDDLKLVVSHQFGSIINTYDRSLDLITKTPIDNSYVIVLYRYGTVDSDTTLLFKHNGEACWLIDGEIITLGVLDENPPTDIRSFKGGTPLMADFDGNGLQDLFVLYDDTFGINEGEGGQYSVIGAKIWFDLGVKNPPNVKTIYLSPEFEIYSDADFGYLTPIDLENDGLFDIIGLQSRWFFAPPFVHNFVAYNTNGAFKEGFPSQAYDGRGKIIADIDLNGDDDWAFLTSIDKEVTFPSLAHKLISKQENQIDLKDLQFRSKAGFPIATRIKRSEYVLGRFLDNLELSLLMINRDEFDILKIPNSEDARIWWSGMYRDYLHSNAVWEPARPFTPPPGGVMMPLDMCYNWPNPATDRTYIRYFLNQAANVNVEVFDLAGEKVTMLSGPGDAGMHNEIEWNLKGIPRGAYFAIVKASAAGRTESKMVKIAVEK